MAVVVFVGGQNNRKILWLGTPNKLATHHTLHCPTLGPTKAAAT